MKNWTKKNIVAAVTIAATLSVATFSDVVADDSTPQILCSASRASAAKAYDNAVSQASWFIDRYHWENLKAFVLSLSLRERNTIALWNDGSISLDRLKEVFSHRLVPGTDEDQMIVDSGIEWDGFIKLSLNRPLELVLVHVLDEGWATWHQVVISIPLSDQSNEDLLAIRTAVNRWIAEEATERLDPPSRWTDSNKWIEHRSRAPFKNVEDYIQRTSRIPDKCPPGSQGVNPKR